MTRRWRLFPKYALLIITLVGSMLVASGAIGIYFSWQESKAHLDALQDEKARNAANRIEQFIRDIEHQLSWTALPRADANGDALEQRRIEYLKLLRQAPEITEVAWIDPEGREQLRISRLAMDAIRSGTDLSQEKKFKDPVAKKQTYYGPVYFRKGTEPYMSLAIPAGSGGGVTATEINLKFVWDVVSNIKVSEKGGGLAYVVDATGTLVAHPDISLVLKKSDLSALPQVAATLRNGTASGPSLLARNQNGEEVLSADAPIRRLSWTVFVESPIAEAFAPLYATLQTTSLVLVVALLISMAASFFLARALVRPLRALQEGAAQIGQGDLDRHIEVRTGDELEGLAEQFNRMSAQLRESYAGLERKVERRTAELTSALEHQTATAEVLRVISSSVADSVPVFEKILESCDHLFASNEQGILLLGDDGRVHLAAHHGHARERLQGMFPSSQTGEFQTQLLERGALHFKDVLADPDVPASIRAIAEQLGIGTYSQVFVPMVWEGQTIGTLYVTRQPPTGFSDKEIELLRTFADQAVIAIQNSRLFNETREALHKVEQRTRELSEALDYQVAISEVLRVISQSSTDVAPVFESILDCATRLFGSAVAAVYRYRDGLVELIAARNWPDEALKVAHSIYPAPPSQAMLAGRVILAGRALSVDDALLDPSYNHAFAQAGAWRRMAGAPMLKDGVPIGAILVAWPEPGATPQRQVDLFKTFADQAVIAIENVRLMNETKEALEQQTATAEILRVISSSPNDVQPVFDAIAKRARLLCSADSSAVRLPAGEGLVARARDLSERALALRLGALEVVPIRRTSITGRAFLEAQSLHIEDMQTQVDEYPDVRDIARKNNFRTVLVVPMLRDGSSIGTLSLFRYDVRPFTAAEIALVKTFADQAVIAIGNVRLFNETKEALEQQTATAEILRVISSSPTDVQPVFDAIAERAMVLCGGNMGAATRFDGEILHLVSYRGTSAQGEAAMRAAFPMPVNRSSANGRSILDRAPVQIVDVRSDPEYLLKDAADLSDWISCLSVPLLHEGRAIGALAAARPEPGPFPEKSIALLETFARQAVLAIENVRLFNETKEALEQQIATAEVLRVISRSQTDVQPVFDTIAAAALRLCDATSANVVTFDGSLVHLAALTSAQEQAADAVGTLFASYPRPLSRETAGMRAILTRSVAMIPDVLQDREHSAGATAVAAGYRSILAVPLLNGDQAIGAIAVARPVPGPLPDKQVTLLRTFADQAVIAIANVRLFNETKEALEQQTATAEVLRVISRSQTDVQPVFDTIAAAALRLCEATSANVVTFDGTLVHLAALASAQEQAADAVRALFASYPKPPGHDTANGRAILTRGVVMIPDVLQDREYSAGATAAAAGYRSILAMPLLSAGRAIGVINIARSGPGPLPDKQVSLLRTFADQAVIAIANVRLFNETKEALERQTATAEILKVIASSPGDVQPVFDAIAASSNRLMAGLSTAVFLLVDDTLHLKAFTRISEEADEMLKASFPLPLGAFPAAAVLRKGAVVQMTDVEVDWGAYPNLIAMARKRGFRSVVWSPLMREGVTVGMISVTRVEPGHFAPHHVELIQTFADQAVIAIENVRLFNEIQEGLRQQTAIASVLKVISQSTFDLHRVLTTLVDNATLLCDASHGFVFRPDGAVYRLAVARGASPEFEAHIAHIPVRPERGFLIGRAVTEKRPVQILDALADPDYRDAESQRLGGYRTMLGVPMLSGDTVVGVIVVWRQEVRAFADKQVELLTTFADQAVIAIENVRLFNQTKEALERQTATAEVLKVISASPTDVQPVLNAVAERAGLLCKAESSRVWLLVPGDKLRAMAEYGKSLGGEDELPLRASSVAGRAFLERKLLHVEDVVPLIDSEFPDVRKLQEQHGFRTVLAVPMLREGQAIGVITLLRRWVQPFPEADVSLVRTFADQAVIAIENTRLFNETKEALDQQIATSEVLQAISNSVADTAPVFDKILAGCERLFNGDQLMVFRLDEQERLVLGAIRGPDAERIERTRRIFPVPLAGTASEQAILERRLVTYSDVLSEPGVPEGLRRIAGQLGETYAVAVAPMLWEGKAIGSILVGRPELRAFDDKEQRLLRTFADQAVIAIQNARLFNETKEALEQQTATSAVLQVISSSVADTQPVFDKILDSCERLFAATGLGIYLVDADGLLRKAGFRGVREKPERALGGKFPRPLEGTATEQAIRERRVIHYPDVLAEPGAPASLLRIARAGGNFSIAFAPMLWEGRGVGAIQVSREPPQPFGEKELALLKTFADQAVIAIQNSRLFEEIQAKSRELELANKHKSEFLANMSHELRTPLNAIIGFSEVLSEKMFGEVNEKQLEYLLDIHTSGQHLLTLINDILDLSKIEAGRMELDLATTSLPMLLDNCTTLVRERASRQGLMLALEVEPGVGDWVADVRKLKQVVINLLSNAVKFTPAGGRVTLRARQLEHAVEIAVVDTGVGIAADQQALVFEEFRQAGGDYLRKSEGTGLGLSLSKRFVELHGGTIRVESAPGRGSTFAFILPERVVEAV